MDGQPNEDMRKTPKQARSRARRDALVELGARALEHQELDELSVAELTAQLGFSTGSFYSYFRDKEDFFIAVQEWVNAEFGPAFEAAIGQGRLAGLPPDARLRACLGVAIAYFRAWTGAVRSALRYERRIPAAWAPNRARTRQIVAAATEGLDAPDRERLETALQLGFGLLVNAILHDPGPLRLSDAGLEDRLVAALAPYLMNEEEGT